VNHSLTFHASLHLMYQLNTQIVHDITIVTLLRHVSASQCHLPAVQCKLQTNWYKPDYIYKSHSLQYIQLLRKSIFNTYSNPLYYYYYYYYLLRYALLKHTAVQYISVLNKKSKIYSFSAVTYQNFPHPTVKFCDLILLNFRTVRTVGGGVLQY
jgi:hypothetical protein